MEDREFLVRIDGHMERGNQHMARGNELMGEIREEMRLSREQRARSDEALERHAEMYLDLRDFTREMILRMERFMNEHTNAILGLSRAIERQTELLGTELRELREEMREESRAQRNALFRILDKLDGPEPGGSAA